MVNSPLIRPYLLGGWHWGGYLRFPWYDFQKLNNTWDSMMVKRKHTHKHKSPNISPTLKKHAARNNSCFGQSNTKKKHTKLDSKHGRNPPNIWIKWEFNDLQTWNRNPKQTYKQTINNPLGIISISFYISVWRQLGLTGCSHLTYHILTTYKCFEPGSVDP